MTSTNQQQCGELIAVAQERTGLTLQQVKDKIGNMNRKAAGRHSKASAALAVQRGPSGFNLFARECDPGSQENKFKAWGEKWQALPEGARRAYDEKAQKFRQRTDEELTDGEKKALSKKLLLQVSDAINRLESLGQESIFLAQSRHDTEGFCRAGSSAGLEFLRGNPNMERQFHLNMSGAEPVTATPTGKRRALEAQVRKMLNAKFAAYSGGTTVKGFPYEAYQTGKVDFRLVGLPDGITLKRLASLGIGKLEAIVAHTSEICIVQGSSNADPQPAPVVTDLRRTDLAPVGSLQVNVSSSPPLADVPAPTMVTDTTTPAVTTVEVTGLNHTLVLTDENGEPCTETSPMEANPGPSAVNQQGSLESIIGVVLGDKIVKEEVPKKELFHVEKILASRKRKMIGKSGKELNREVKEYLVQWVGFPGGDTWEPTRHVPLKIRREFDTRNDS